MEASTTLDVPSVEAPPKQSLFTDVLLTPDEAAELLRVTQEWLNVQVQKGRLGCVDLGHRIRRYWKSQLDDFARRCTINPK